MKRPSGPVLRSILVSSSAGYLDDIFAALRALGKETDALGEWVRRAEQTDNMTWRWSFLREARASLARIDALRDAAVRALDVLGDPEHLPPPLDRIAQNLAGMAERRADQAARIDALEAIGAGDVRAGQA